MKDTSPAGQPMTTTATAGVLDGQEPLPGMEEWARIERQNLVVSRADQLAELRHDNGELMRELQQVGGTPDRGSIALIRLNALVDMMGLDEADLLAFEVLFEQRMGAALHATAVQVRKAKLTEPLRQAKDPSTVSPFFKR